MFQVEQLEDRMTPCPVAMPLADPQQPGDISPPAVIVTPAGGLLGLEFDIVIAVCTVTDTECTAVYQVKMFIDNVDNSSVTPVIGNGDITLIGVTPHNPDGTAVVIELEYCNSNFWKLCASSGVFIP
jgi:hypothetical protein